MKDVRQKKLILNSFTGLANQVVILVCGFVLPAMILQTYGSNVNGLVSSITEFLGLIALMELGVGAVVKAALFKPLAENNVEMLSRIYRASNSFFRKVAGVFLVYVAVLSVLYPTLDSSGFGFLYEFSLIVVIAIAQFAQYFFGITNQLLLGADQRVYVASLAQSASLVLSTVACCALMISGQSIQVVKAAGTILLVLRPMIMHFYVKRRYDLRPVEKNDGDVLEQKWNALAQHVAAVVLNSTDVVVLTMLTSYTTVSIYVVHSLVVRGVKQLVDSLTTGVQGLMGDMLARGELNELREFFSTFESFVHVLVVVAFTCTGLLIEPFISVYVSGIEDAGLYYVPVFAVTLVAAQAVYLLRLPYSILVLAAGHFKETQISAFVEMGINIVLSVALVYNFGLVGVAVGTLAAMTYRTIYYVWYMKKVILVRSPRIFIRHLVADVIAVAFAAMVCLTIIDFSCSTYFEWGLLALPVVGITLIFTCISNMLLFRKDFVEAIRMFANKLKR